MAATRRGVRDLTGLTVLALLLTGPRHPYELHRVITQTHKDFVTGLPRSLYHAVGRLERDEFIEAVETEREGHRPERTVYRITDEGRRELRSRLRYLLERPDPDTTLLAAAVSFMGCLPTGEVRYCLRSRAAALEGAIAGADAQAADLRRELPRLLLLENEYTRAVWAAELAWVRGILADLESGALTWPDDAAELAGSVPVEARE
ncbi:PadR family transcriptional regulator [Streptomonospora nanhaiensis]|uniref:DNA-binding PadR family transcriptional regulator n=1 Tax=Streptomonospora nanhaiensis TaxID=1323731 RepID=A0A853BKV5_9ACTN|nr:PadR family transcriptional regulator [Streptomonospora nanhaiensis]MBV2364208.1 PadR family transcriptional regulator [Streptomonospora nanhaiensis]MBX9386672.1 PadR family transcriptional regulator [Streptomonospora nanhaiensis]NYI95162.1 DNA-binding PadR family transcriptional regulator [Streptomonospora nanhaiensis]